MIVCLLPGRFGNIVAMRRLKKGNRAMTRSRACFWQMVTGGALVAHQWMKDEKSFYCLVGPDVMARDLTGPCHAPYPYTHIKRIAVAIAEECVT